uniref:Uncharacterized protein n=1 Tax=Anopheles farauti TaxID=69004 RepID=A0A182QA27_9DIPT
MDDVGVEQVELGVFMLLPLLLLAILAGVGDMLDDCDDRLMAYDDLRSTPAPTDAPPPPPPPPPPPAPPPPVFPCVCITYMLLRALVSSRGFMAKVPRECSQ